MRRALPLALLLLAPVAWALAIDRGIVEEGLDTTAAEGAVSTGTGGSSTTGVLLVNGNGTTRMRPATCTSNTCTRAAPSLSTEGLSLEDITSWRVSACAPSGNTLSGTGTLEFWAYDPVTALWGHLKAKDLLVTEGAARCQAFAVEVNSMAGASIRGVYRANGVGISAATGTLIVSMQACKRGSVPLGSFGAPGCGA